ncbi:hypothetical protein ACFOJ6_20955 [Gordonia humi]|uniref:hypothetical protein n=1 Tax=Gordonia humi TaxID=686429 RepID=UPI00361E7649
MSAITASAPNVHGTVMVTHVGCSSGGTPARRRYTCQTDMTTAAPTSTAVITGAMNQERTAATSSSAPVPQPTMRAVTIRPPDRRR